MKENIACYLKVITNILDKSKTNSLRKYEITSSQADILVYLFMNENKEIYQKDIEKHFELTNPTVNGIINRLELKKLVYRQKDEFDKRLTLIKLTENGLKMKKNMELDAKKFNEILLNNISNKDLETLNKVLQKLFENAKSIQFKESEL